MSTYEKCPSCGNRNEGDEIYKCPNCGEIFCTRCGITNFGDFCPLCESKNDRRSGILQGKIKN